MDIPVENWNSGYSPYFYEIVLLPQNVSLCYECHKKFEDECHFSQNNIIIKHQDRHITGTDVNGCVTYAKYFTATYYHFDIQHIWLYRPLFRTKPNYLYITDIVSLFRTKHGISTKACFFGNDYEMFRINI